jgi:glycosyltransferase involved in cell wall biosynthesis
MGRALAAAGFNLSYLGPLQMPSPRWYRLKGRLLRMRGWDYLALAEPRVLKSYARQVEAKLRSARGQVLLSCGKPPLAYLETRLPTLFFDDGSVPAIMKLYPGHTHYHPRVQAQALEMERRVLEKCRYACYMSEWAAEEAIATYGPRFKPRIKVVPIGANLDDTPTPAEVEQAIQSRPGNRCTLLFVGVEWNRKGGPIALAVTQELHRRGVDVRLEVVGCVPPAPVPDFVKVRGFVSKQSAEGARLIKSLYRECHFLLLPSQAEAYGIAFVEANAHGLPALGCRVGGVPTIVHDGENGWLFPLDAPAEAYASRIQRCLQAPEDYARFCRSSFTAFQTRLSWKQFGATVHALVSQALRA